MKQIGLRTCLDTIEIIEIYIMFVVFSWLIYFALENVGVPQNCPEMFYIFTN